MPEHRVTLVSTEVIYKTNATPTAKVTLEKAEVLFTKTATPDLRVTSLSSEVLYTSDVSPSVRVTSINVEVLYIPPPAYTPLSKTVVILNTFANGDEWKIGMDSNLTTLGHMLSQLHVIDRNLSTPPGSPVNGDRYIIAPGGSGAWSGHSAKVTAWNSATSTWDIYNPSEGWLIYIVDEAVLTIFKLATGWSSGIAI